MSTLYKLACAFIEGFRQTAVCDGRNDKALRDNLSERQVDKMVNDSFPASDPPSTY